MLKETVEILEMEIMGGTMMEYARVTRVYSSGKIHGLSVMLDRLSSDQLKKAYKHRKNKVAEG